jgi:hypothetical protein
MHYSIVFFNYHLRHHNRPSDVSAANYPNVREEYDRVNLSRWSRQVPVDNRSGHVVRPLLLVTDLFRRLYLPLSVISGFWICHSTVSVLVKLSYLRPSVAR